MRPTTTIIDAQFTTREGLKMDQRINYTNLIVTIVVGIVAAGSAFLGAGRYIANLERDVIDLKSKLTNVEGQISEAKIQPIGSNRQLVEKTSDLARKLSELAVAHDQLARDVTTLSKMSSNGTSAAVDLSQVNARLSSLETAISELNTARPNTSGKIEIKSDYQSNFSTISSGDFDVSLLGCRKSATRVKCNYLFKNQTNRNIRHNIETGNGSRGIVSSGKSIRPASVQINEEVDRTRVYYVFPPRIPTPVEISFDKIPTSSKGFLLLELYHEGNMAKFEGVTFTE